MWTQTWHISLTYKLVKCYTNQLGCLNNSNNTNNLILKVY